MLLLAQAAAADVVVSAPAGSVYPVVPVGNQFSHPTLETPADLHPKVDVPLNALRDYVNTLPGVAFARLRVALRPATALAVPADTNIPFSTVLEDTAAGWNAASNSYTIPPGGGLFLVSGQLVQSTAISFRMYLTGIPTGITGQNVIVTHNCPAAANTGPRLVPIPIRFAGGETVSLSLTSSSTPSAAADDGVTDKHWFSVIGVSA